MTAGVEGPAVHRVPHAVELRGVLARPGARAGAGAARPAGARPAPRPRCGSATSATCSGARPIFWLLGHGVRRFPAVHMTWGAINEWTANAAYNRLATIADHPVLTELLGRIMRQEGRHAGVLRQLRPRPARRTTVAAQRVTPWFLRHQWAPVGNGDVPQDRDVVRHRVPVRRRRGCRADRAHRGPHRRASRARRPEPGARRHRRGGAPRGAGGGRRAVAGGWSGLQHGGVADGDGAGPQHRGVDTADGPCRWCITSKSPSTNHALVLRTGQRERADLAEHAADLQANAGPHVRPRQAA